MPLYPCSICETPIEMPECHRKRIKYTFCSDPCRNTPFMPKQCVVCGKEFLVTYHNARNAKYCSTDCLNTKIREGQDHKKAPKVELTCEQCGKPFKVRRSIGKVQRYCSQKCAMTDIGRQHSGINSAVWKAKYKIVCAHCGKEFEAHESRHERAKYCSRQCSTLGNLDRFAAGERTDIEIAMALALKQHRIRFTEQVIMFDKFMVDFLLSDYPIVIQCDGLFWHDRPRTKDRDTGQDRYLAKAGYTVLRFSDKQINGNIDTCIKRIKQAIKNPGQIPLINSH